MPATAFRDCDIRGVYGRDVTDDLARRLGGAMADLLGGGPVIVAADLRASTPPLVAALVAGLLEGGSDVVDCGEIPTPTFYFARDALGIEAGVMVTASHNPADHNGFKPVLGALPILPDELATLRDLATAPGAGRADTRRRPGRLRHADVVGAYEAWLDERVGRAVAGEVPFAPVVVDAGHGSLWRLGPAAFERRGFRVARLFCSPDGTFPSRAPNPAEARQLAALGAAVVEAGAFLGVAFDGDGDRVGIVDERGSPVPMDAVIALVARDLLEREGPGAVVLDIKCSRAIDEVVRAAGGTTRMEKSGHTFMKRRVITSGAAFGGELSGHLFYRDLGGRDDALYSAIRVASLIAASGRPLSALVAELPQYVTSPDLRIPFVGDAAALVDEIAAAVDDRCSVLRLDGVRADWPDGWGLVRPSVTEPLLTLRFEAHEASQLAEIVRRFLAASPSLRTNVERELEARGVGATSGVGATGGARAEAPG